MMKILISFCLLILHVCNGKAGSDKTWVTINENKKTYEFSTVFPPGQTHEVLSYMDKCLDVSTSLKNTETDAMLTLDNKYTFYMKSHPGELVLKFDKRKNTPAACTKFKEMCEGIRNLLKHKS